MAKQFLDLQGLSALIGKIKSTFLTQSAFNQHVQDLAATLESGFSDANKYADDAVAAQAVLQAAKDKEQDDAIAGLTTAAGENLAEAKKYADDAVAAQVAIQAATDKAQDDRIKALEDVEIKTLTLNGKTYNGSADVTADYGVNYDSANKKIYLTLDGANVGTGIDATDFLVDGMLEDVDYVVIPDDEQVEGLDAGRYLKFTFNTSEGQTKDPIYVNVTDLVDVYTLTNGADSMGTYVGVRTVVSQAEGGTKNDWVVKAEINDSALVSTINNMNQAIGTKANSADVYKKGEVDNALALKADLTYVDDEIASLQELLATEAIPTATVESTFEDLMK